MALKDIKNKIRATDRTHKVTRAMEAVSAVKMRTTQSTALSGRAYARASLSILARLSGSGVLKNSKFICESDNKLSNNKNKIALILITSDKGLAGGLNSGVIKMATENIAEYSVDDIAIYAYGKKGEEYFRRRGYKIISAFENKKDNVDISFMEELVKEVSNSFAKGDYKKVIVAYSNFKSTFEQLPTVRTLLPLSLESVATLVKDIVPEKGKWSEEREIKSPAVYTIEPDEEEVLSVLAPRLVSVSLYHFLLESKASEHSARMVAMKHASDKSKEVSQDLTRLFNKIRQASITREVSEIISGREALAT